MPSVAAKVIIIMLTWRKGKLKKKRKIRVKRGNGTPEEIKGTPRGRYEILK